MESYEGTVRVCGDPDQFNTRAGDGGSRRSFRKHWTVQEHHATAGGSGFTARVHIAGRRFGNGQKALCSPTASEYVTIRIRRSAISGGAVVPPSSENPSASQ